MIQLRIIPSTQELLDYYQPFHNKIVNSLELYLPDSYFTSNIIDMGFKCEMYSNGEEINYLLRPNYSYSIPGHLYTFEHKSNLLIFNNIHPLLLNSKIPSFSIYHEEPFKIILIKNINLINLIS